MKRLGVLAVCALIAIGALPAMAAPYIPPVAPPSLARLATPEAMQVQLWPSEPGGIGLIVTATLATGTPLPATVRIPLPVGAQVTWTGEIAGTTTGVGDIESSHTVAAGTGGQVVVVRIEKYREIQVEAILGEPKAVGDKLGATLEWVQSAPADSLAFGVKMIPTATDVVIQPAPPGPASRSEAGEQLWGFAPRTVKTGEKLTLAVTYRQGATTVATGGSTTSPLLFVLIALLVVAVVAFLVVAARTLADRSAERVEADDDEAGPDADDPPSDAGADDDPFDVDWK